MDLLLSVMSTGTCFTREQLYRYHKVSPHLKAGEANDKFTQLHSTSYPAPPPMKDIIARHDRVIVPVRDPILSLITGFAKGNSNHHQYQRIRGWRGILQLWDHSKFYAFPIDIQSSVLRAQYARRIFGGLDIEWDRVVNSTPHADKWDRARQVYLDKGIVPDMPPSVLSEWEQAREQIQRFMQSLGYSHLPWWR